ncbi:MAG: TraB/GumN family protein [Verrucomicrobiota bacterium]
MHPLRPPVFLTFFLTLLLSALRAEETAPAASPAAPPPSSAPATPAGLVWRVSGGKSPMFLAGSFHLMRLTDYPLPAAYEQAWRESRQVVFEIMPGEMEKPEVQRKIAALGLLEEGKLSDRISAETWKNLSGWAEESGTPTAMLQRFQPWMAGLTVAVSAFEKQGYRSSFGMEKFFAGRLKESGKTAIGLETPVGQIGVFARISPRQQEDVLRQALEEVKQPEKVEQLAASWRAGDAAAVYTRMHDSFAEFPELEKTLLTDRNISWIPALEKMLQGDQPTLVMVGAGHLCGPGSVTDLLEKKGYRPVPLIPAAAPAPVKKAA